MRRAVTTAKTRTAVDELESLFKALADKTRLRILALLGSNEVCVCHIHDSLGLPQPTVSRHLAYLRRTGLVSARRDGVWMHYQVSGSLTSQAPGAGMPAASRIRLRKKIPAGNCFTGDVTLAGVEIRANDGGTFDAVNHDCGDGAVVAVAGVANGDTGL